MKSVRSGRQAAAYAAGVALVIAADQLFKSWITAHIPLNAGQGTGNIPLIPGVVHLTYIRNSGAAFGMLQGGRWIFLLLLAAFCVLVVWALHRNILRAPLQRWLAVLAAAAAVANGIDRALRGYVVDMFELEFMRFAVFNVADAVMNVCAVLFVLLLLFQKEKKSE